MQNQKYIMKEKNYSEKHFNKNYKKQKKSDINYQNNYLTSEYQPHFENYEYETHFENYDNYLNDYPNYRKFSNHQEYYSAMDQYYNHELDTRNTSYEDMRYNKLDLTGYDYPVRQQYFEKYPDKNKLCHLIK